jgi:hypothetical protein
VAMTGLVLGIQVEKHLKAAAKSIHIRRKFYRQLAVSDILSLYEEDGSCQGLNSNDDILLMMLLHEEVQK